MKLTRFHCLLGVAATAAALLAGCASSSGKNGIKRYKSVQEEEEASRQTSKRQVKYLPPPSTPSSKTEVEPMGVVVIPIRNSRGEYVIPPQKGANAPTKNGDEKGEQRR